MAEEKRDYYEVLGVQKGCTDDELKKAYRQLAKNTILTSIRAIKMQKQNSKRSTRLMLFCPIRKNVPVTTSLVMQG